MTLTQGQVSKAAVRATWTSCPRDQFALNSRRLSAIWRVSGVCLRVSQGFQFQPLILLAPNNLHDRSLTFVLSLSLHPHSSLTCYCLSSSAFLSNKRSYRRHDPPEHLPRARRPPLLNLG